MQKKEGVLHLARGVVEAFELSAMSLGRHSHKSTSHQRTFKLKGVPPLKLVYLGKSNLKKKPMPKVIKRGTLCAKPTTYSYCARAVCFLAYSRFTVLGSKHGCACTVGICFVLSSSSWGRL